MVSKIPTARYYHINAVIRERVVRAWQQEARVDDHAHFMVLLVRLLIIIIYQSRRALSFQIVHLININRILFIFYSFPFFRSNEPWDNENTFLWTLKTFYFTFVLHFYFTCVIKIM